MKKILLSVIIPQYLEPTALVRKTCKTVVTFLNNKHISHEVIVCQNGSLQHSTLKDPHIIIHKTKQTGLGVALRLGIKAARGEYVYFLPADNPYQGSDIKQFLKHKEDYDLICGSKLHPESTYEISRHRKWGTKIDFLARQLLFPDYPIKDPNGNFLGRTGLLKPLGAKIKADNYIFTTLLVYHTYQKNARILEVPVIYKKSGGTSSVNVLKDGSQHFIELLKMRLESHRK